MLVCRPLHICSICVSSDFSSPLPLFILPITSDSFQFYGVFRERNFWVDLFWNYLNIIYIYIYIIIWKLTKKNSTDFSRIESKSLLFSWGVVMIPQMYFTSFHWPYLRILLYHSLPSSPLLELMQLWEENNYCSWLPLPQRAEYPNMLLFDP